MEAVQASIGMNWTGRIKAMLIHFLFTVLVAALAGYLIFGIWYPAPFHKMSRGLELFGLIIACDIALGPLISLVIYNLKKPRSELIRDYLIVGLLQFSMLAYGVYSVSQGRPAVVTYNKGLYKVLLANELVAESMARAQSPYDHLRWFGELPLVGVKKPTNKEAGGDVLASIAAGLDWDNFPENYIPYEQSSSEALKYAVPLDELLKRKPQLSTAVHDALSSVGRQLDSVRYIPLAFNSASETPALLGKIFPFAALTELEANAAFAKTGLVLIDAKSAAVLGYFMINPL